MNMDSKAVSSFDPGRSVLVVVAHPDDAEFACGGAVALWTEQGVTVNYVLATRGDKGTNDPNMLPERLATIREAEQREAARTLGVSEVVFFGLPDGELEDTPALRKAVVREIRRFRPDTVITSDPLRRYQQHRDHRIIGQVTLDAVFPYARDYHHFPDLYREEGLEPHKVLQVLIPNADDADVWIDISSVIDRKIAALRCHATQVGDDEALAERIRQMAARIGAASGLAFAEAFRRIEYRR
jgi:LmbE family N-acetylglucosaminyl deacetylase